MKINYEIQIDLEEVKDGDILDEIEDRLENSTCLWTTEAQKLAEPKIVELQDKLDEIRRWLLYPNLRELNKNNPENHE